MTNIIYTYLNNNKLNGESKNILGLFFDIWKAFDFQQKGPKTTSGLDGKYW